jgi:hypothetical protein
MLIGKVKNRPLCESTMLKDTYAKLGRRDYVCPEIHHAKTGRLMGTVTIV